MKKIQERISEITGLKTEQEIQAYSHFCKHSDLKSGIILYGDVQHEFYRKILSDASFSMKFLEESYNDAIGNRIHEDLLGRKHNLFNGEDRLLKSPISKSAQQEFAKYYHQFMEMGLISIPEKTAYSQEYYPILKGYNYFNDSDFYRVTQNGSGRELII